MSRDIHLPDPSAEGAVARQQRLLSASRLLDHEAFISAFQSWEGPDLDSTNPASGGPGQPTSQNDSPTPETPST